MYPVAQKNYPAYLLTQNDESSAVSVPIATSASAPVMGNSMLGRIVPQEGASSQHQGLLQAQGASIIEEAQSQIEIMRQNLDSFKNVSQEVPVSHTIILGEQNNIQTQPTLPSRAMTDAEKEAHRRASTFFFKTCTDYYGETILNDLYPPTERATLIQEGRPLEVGKVRDFLRKADVVVDDVRRFLEMLPKEPTAPPQEDHAAKVSENGSNALNLDELSVAQSLALAHHATREVTEAREAYEQLGPSAQHVLEALGRALMAPVGIGVPLAIAAALPPVAGLPHLAEAAIALIPSFVFPTTIAYNHLLNRYTSAQVVNHAPETAQGVLLGSSVVGGVIGFTTGPSIGAAVFTHSASAPLITLGTIPAVGVILGSLVVCPIIAASYFAIMGGGPTMAMHAPFFPASESLERYSASRQAEQRVVETETRATESYVRALNDIRPFVDGNLLPDANEVLPPVPQSSLRVKKVREPHLAGRFL